MTCGHDWSVHRTARGRTRDLPGRVRVLESVAGQGQGLATCHVARPITGDPHSPPWRRGANENTNGLPRQYFPKGSGPAVRTTRSSRSGLRTQPRPRLILGDRTPAEAMGGWLTGALAS
jgi:hypothetical protein